MKKNETGCDEKSTRKKEKIASNKHETYLQFHHIHSTRRMHRAREGDGEQNDKSFRQHQRTRRIKMSDEKKNINERNIKKYEERSMFCRSDVSYYFVGTLWPQITDVHTNERTLNNEKKIYETKFLEGTMRGARARVCFATHILSTLTRIQEDIRVNTEIFRTPSFPFFHSCSLFSHFEFHFILLFSFFFFLRILKFSVLFFFICGLLLFVLATDPRRNCRCRPTSRPAYGNR